MRVVGDSSGAGGALPRWSRPALEDLLGRGVVFARDLNAAPVDLPFPIGIASDRPERLWTESTSEIHFEDRPVIAYTWWDALAAPGVVATMDVRREDHGRWVAERIVMLNLTHQDDVGVVLVGIEPLGEIDPPPSVQATEPGHLADAASVRRPTWALQELDPLGIVVNTEGHVEEIFGQTASALEGRVVLEVIHPDDHATSLEMWTDLLEHPGSLRHVTQRILRPDGSVCWIEANVMNRLTPDGGHVLSLVHDVTERRSRDRELHSRARTDTLTGLANRGALLADLEERLGRGPVTVAFMDLDGFKAVNDRHGHLTGDAVLDALARRLSAAIPPVATVGRWGGDEFVVACSAARPDQIEAMVRSTLEDPISVDGVVWQPSASIGVVVAEAGCEPDDVVRSADRLMYQQKSLRPG